MELTSFIIVNWNGRHLLADCIDSILAQSVGSYEIIVVDNGSRDGSLEFLCERYPQVRTVALSSNLGFTGGNIEGLRAARGGYVVLLNNDAVLTERWLELMVEGVTSGEDIGFCSSKIVIAGTELIDSVGDTFTTAFTGTKMGELEHEGLYNEPRVVPGACAAAVLYKRSMLEEIGFLDDDFFLNHEDTDLNLRAWLAGWRCLYVPGAVVHHKVSASIGALSDTSVYYFSRNNEWVWLKNIPLSLMIRHLPQRLLYEISSFCFFCFMAGKWRPYLRGKKDAVLGAPRMLRKRREMSRLRRLSGEKIRRELIPITGYLRHRLELSRAPKLREESP